MSHHLVSATDSHDGCSVTTSLKNGLSHPVTAQFVQIAKGVLTSRQQDNIGFQQIIHVVRVVQIHPLIVLQHIEIGKIGQVTKQDYRHIDFSLYCLPLLLGKFHRILFFNVNILIIRYHAQYRNAANLFQHLHARFKQTEVATELVDDDALDALAVFRSLQSHRTIGTGKHTSPVDVGHQNHISICMTRHGQIHQISIFQVEFRNAAGPLHHNRIVTSSQPVESLIDFPTQLLTPFGTEIFIRTPVADGFSVQHHLGRPVGSGFQQQGIHVSMARYARRFGLHRLCPANLQSFGRGIRIKCHVLCLERGRMIPVLQEYTA